ncbi:MAG: alpha/beta hydrolase [Vulcanimicrobiota bacterium]
MRLLKTSLLLLLGCLPAAAQEPTRGGRYSPVWLGKGEALKPEQIDHSLAPLLAQKPQHLVVMVHGYGIPKDETKEDYAKVSENIKQVFDSQGVRSAVLGVEWESAIPGDQVPWQTEDAYFKAITRARTVGHVPLRQLLLAVQQKSPGTRVDVLSHSLGCEVSAAAIYPELTYQDDAKDFAPAFAPGRPLKTNFWGLLGSDLDYDVWYKSGMPFSAKSPRVGMHWMTISSYTGDRDKALLVRKFSRGYAGGTAIPRMTEGQWDTLMGNRTLMLDNQDVPASHDFSQYLSRERLQRMLPTALYAGQPQRFPKPPEVAQMDKIRALPNNSEAIKPWLNSPYLSSQMVALWRLEHILCGSSKHLADGTIEDQARLMRNQPARVKAERKDSKCVTISRGYWPTQEQLTRAGAPNW